MDIYIKEINNKIIELNDVEFEDYTLKLEVQNFDEFFNITKKELSRELEHKLQRILDIVEEEQLSLQKFNIKHWVSNRSFGEIIDMYLSGEIMKPNMQREFVWDSLKCSRLIESIILGLPIPPFFLLEVEKNKYEIIDGFQRITTLVNYVSGLPWNFNIHVYAENNGEINIEKIKEEANFRDSKLSKQVLKEIGNKSFKNLDTDYQRMIKRSTIPLIEFNQVSPDNFDSKYLIFERINTGSEKLNAMQIRKSLAYGDFMENLYEVSNQIEQYISLFSTNSLKKDVHVEAYLRTYVMSKIYLGEFTPQKSGIKNILNEFCERNRNAIIDPDFKSTFEVAFNIIYNSFNKKKGILFKRTDIFESHTQLENKFIGNLNIGILEAFIGTLIIKINQGKDFKKGEDLLFSYIDVMNELGEQSVLEERNNPFTANTGAIESIKERFEILNTIIGD